MTPVTASDVVELINWLEQHGIDVWLNGGWGVDALLGHQTRPHDDLDITISAKDRDAFTSAMRALGFTVHRIDNEFNWVLLDGKGRLVDVHLVDFTETLISGGGQKMYGPGGLPFEVGSLDGRGVIAGKAVRCETADFQIRGHTSYTPDAADYADVVALCQAFGIEVPDLFTNLGFHRPST
ncbi:MAG: aminoglycoside nucleotidyltransferase [Candidatus Dormibacteraeota bacterium]|nr:aminoglycoside nucleotidyltransferase [Candidatus Dormibacteraeota bacterium]